MNTFDDIEVVTFDAGVGIEASNLAGNTGFQGETVSQFEGLELVDYDEIVDRNERLVLLQAHHALSVYANSTETADGTVAAAVEISASPAVTSVGQVRLSTSSVNGNDYVGSAGLDDTIDLIGRPLAAVGHAPFSDGSTGTGGGGSAGEDQVSVTDLPREMAEFHPRDELFLNGEMEPWNVDDAGIHLIVKGQHIYGVEGD